MTQPEAVVGSNKAVATATQTSIPPPPPPPDSTPTTPTDTRRSSGRGSGRMSLIFQGIAGRRAADYPSDGGNETPQQASVKRFSFARFSFSQTTTASGGADDTTSALSPASKPPSCWTRFVRQTIWPGQERKYKLYLFLYNPYYKTIMIVLAFVLLFGAQIRNALLPPSADTACDAIFMATFVLFALDILIRLDAEPNYWQCGWNPTVQFGSFLLWCDIISTLTLLHEISFIDKKNFSELSYSIYLDPFGIPASGMDQVNASLPIRPEIALLVTIGKTARIARFIRSSTAIKISSKVNWYWFLNLINPFWYLQSLVRLCQSCFARINNNNTSKNKKHSASVADDFTSGGISNDDSQFLQQQQSTWGGGALAAIREDERTKAQARPSGLRSWPGRVVRQLGVGSSASNWRRQIAATRIQRAWRRYQASQQGGGHNAPVTKRSRSKRASSKLERRLSATSGSKRRLESQVGTAMRELTGQRVAIGIIMALVLTVLFTYTEDDATRPTTMIVLHNQTGNPLFVDKSLDVARQTAVPDLFLYTLADGSMRNFSIPEVTQDYSGLRPRERYVVTVVDYFGGSTQGVFAYRDERKEEALVSTLSTLFILLVWFFGVTAFAGPVMVLVVIPIERMNSLLSMLMQNPLGYETTHRYKRFIDEEDAITKNTRWTKEVLKGMETSFLMSTILRIGSLMKVGFGSAGVEIIRNNLEKGQNKNMLMLNSQGSSVSCIFLFCDIRQFTDATECLQEEVFVFTNRIAAVVHSICTAYGGSANKNIGDAFLLSWLLDDGDPSMNFDGDDNFTANSNQADKALLSVVRICMALHYDDFYIGAMSDQARNALLTKLAKRKGPVVQMGFGLHAGKAVQGAIGSQRKIDATYVSEHVEKAEFLESSTKKYGVMMLMSDAFHRLLQPNNKRRCRKVDQLLVLEDAEDWEDDYFDDASGKRIDLYTFDMDIDALWRNQTNKKASKPDNDQESDSDTGSGKGVTTSRRDVLRLSGGRLMAARRRSVATLKDQASEDLSDARGSVADDKDGGAASELVLPSGPAIYNANVWISEEMRKVRFLYTDGLFFQKFSSGLQAFYSKDWDFAKQCFSTILDRFEDGPSRYFMSQIETNDGVPPKGFKEYGTA